MTLKDTPSEAEVVASMKRCAAVFDHMILLRASAATRYNKLLQELKKIRGGAKGSGLLAELDPMEADSVLDQLEIEEAAKRPEIEAVLNPGELEEGFMGDEGRFVQLDEAVQSGELEDFYRR